MVDIFGSRAFLLVEDFEAMRSVLRGLLRRCGAQRVDTAASGQEATNLLRKTPYDVVLCDYNLGVGKNGQMLLEESRVKGWITPAAIWIMITAEKSADMISAAAENAPDDYLLKPITEGALQTRLQRLLDRKAVLADVVEAMQANDNRRALQLCTERLAAKKNVTELLRLQAQLHQLLGETDRARAVYEAVLSRAEVAWAKFGLAKLQLDAGQHREALARLENIVREHPQYIEAYDSLANALEREGQVEQQMEILQRAVQISPNSPARQTAIGGAALRSGDHDLAAQAFQRSIKLSEHSGLKTPAPFLGLAKVQTETGAPNQALQTLSELVRQIDSDEAQVLAKGEEARAHQKAGNPEAAQAAARQAQERCMQAREPLSAQATLQVAEALMQAGQRSAASDLLQFVARNHHEDQDILARAQQVFDEGGMTDEGRGLLGASREQATEAMNEGVGLLAKGDLTAALQSMRKARDLMPQNPRVLLNLAYVAITSLEKGSGDSGLAEEAQSALATASRIKQGDARARDLSAKLAKWRKGG